MDLMDWMDTTIKIEKRAGGKTTSPFYLQKKFVLSDVRIHCNSISNEKTQHLFQNQTANPEIPVTKSMELDTNYDSELASVCSGAAGASGFFRVSGSFGSSGIGFSGVSSTIVSRMNCSSMESSSIEEPSAFFGFGLNMRDTTDMLEKKSSNCSSSTPTAAAPVSCGFKTFTFGALMTKVGFTTKPDLIAFVLTLIRKTLPSMRTRTFCKLMFQRLLLTLCAWLTVFPTCGPRPVSWHLRDILCSLTSNDRINV